MPATKGLVDIFIFEPALIGRFSPVLQVTVKEPYQEGNVAPIGKEHQSTLDRIRQIVSQFAGPVIMPLMIVNNVDLARGTQQHACASQVKEERSRWS